MMSPSLQPPPADGQAADAADPALVRQAGAWVDQLQRTLKVSRLYDAANPTVVRFQQDLSAALVDLVGRHGALALQVGPNAISCGGEALLTARSHDDNLPGVLHRDGIRVLTIEPGVEAREVESLVEQILKVTSPSAGEEDLVTLLWEASLPHVILETVPLEGEADGGAEDGSERATGAAWPRQEIAPPPVNAAPPQAGATPLPQGGTPSADDEPRSDDWATGEAPTDLDRAFDELETAALVQLARFQHEYEAGCSTSIAAGAVCVLEDCFADDLTAADRDELGGLIPRVLRESLGQGNWAAASVALRLLRTCAPEWPAEEFSRELCAAPGTTTRRVVDCLDGQEREDVESFLALAREFGPPLAEWLLYVLAESQRMQVRRPLAKTIGELLAGHPEVLVPWLTDARWYVVRNAVHILGWIGAEESVNYLRVPAEHAEIRVRREVVATLGQARRDDARPILIGMAATAEPSLFATIVKQLALDEDAAVQDWLLQQLLGEAFARRPEEERRAVYLALATRGDAVVPALEAELNRGGLLSRRPEPDRTAIALCLARIGTPAARGALGRGLHSGRPAVRKACAVAGASGGTGDE